MKNILKRLLRSALPNLLAILIFGGVAYLYCKPAFEDKVLSQEDVLQWQGMSHNSFEYKEKHGHFPLWSNSMYGGMPGYQIAMDTRSVNIPDLFYGALTFYLAKPASFFFLACICFYFLAGALRVNPYIGIIGALAYAYATYNAVIIAVGHDTKMQSIAMMPGVIGALILICERKYWLGMVILALFSALLVSVNHIQIMYYILIIAIGLLAGYGIPWIRKGEGRRLGQVILMAAGATLVGILSNAVVIFTTYDASKESTRAGSELTDNTGNTTHNGLTDSAAFEFSMYKLEPLVMLVPDIFGGSTDLQLPSQQSRAVRVMDQMPPDLVARIGEDGPRYYWGGVGKFFAGPPYAGAIIILLVLIGLFVLDNRHKWWILSVSLLAILMSWGGYFLFFNQFLLKWLPLYNKFRAPSMILVIPTFLFCLMGVLTLDKIWLAENRTDLWRQYKWGLLSTAGVFLMLLGLYFHFNYSSPWETDLLKKTQEHGSSAIGYMQAFVHALREDRQTLFGNSLLRSFSLMLAGAFIIGLYIRKRISPGFLLAVIGILIFGDVLSLDLNYLNEDNYMEKEEYQQNFAATDADKQISQDKGYFRVFDVRDSAYNALTYGAMTAYFHFSIGGYHAAKLKIYEDLITRQLYNFPNCKPVINMLNTKYIIKPVAGGGDSVLRNSGSLGPVWFVKAVRFEPTAQDVMNQLSYFNPKDTAIVFAADSGNVRLNSVAADSSPAPADTAGSISLVKNDNDEITYLSQSPGNRFAVFSEVYYNRGWRAWIDDHEAPIIRTNYVLRGLSIPPGRHVIRFFFRPLSFYLGRQIQWMASIIFLLMMVGAIIVAIQEFRHESDSLHGGALLQAA
jgi:hypothetical protein